VVQQALRQSGVDLEVGADANVSGGGQVHNVVDGESLGSKSAEPPGEFLCIDHL
jgi:hypothetical protein